jgi:hypothetical protein
LVPSAHHRSGVKAARILLGGVLVLLCGAPALRAQDAPVEYAVKATYLYKFVPFVQWPAASFPSPTSPVMLCVVGDGSFSEILNRAVSGERIEGRPLLSRRLPAVDADSGCHVLYTAGSSAQSVAQGLAAVQGKPVLTVTDSLPAAGAKGIVNFVLADNRVRFEIDNQAAAENGLLISSKLLSLAISVRPRG